jgi:hypothetical protein
MNRRKAALNYTIDSQTVDSIGLKCLVVSRGLKVNRKVYKRFSGESRLDISPLTCNCLMLSDGTICQLTDMSFHLEYLSGVLSWNNLKLLRYASKLTTPFSLELIEDKAALLYDGQFLDFVTFPKPSDFYKQVTSRGTPFLNNAVLQGVDWVCWRLCTLTCSA